MSDKSRRKILKSIAAGSGAIVAGKSLPESWSRPVVDSVMLPAHAQTSAIDCSIVITFVANATVGSVSGTYSYFIDYYPPEGLPIGEVDDGTFDISLNSLNESFTHTLPPGEYLLCGGSGANGEDSARATGKTTVTCCSASYVLGEWSFPGDGGDGGCVILKVVAGGTCQITPEDGGG